MRLFSGLSLSVLTVLCSVASGAGELTRESMPSLQGFTGILNTPSAHVISEGSIHLMYSDQRENIWRNDQQNSQDNYLMSLGLFSFFELGGRLTEAPGRARDLSASIKASSAQITRDHALWPVVAVGVQDVGGGSNLLRSRYAVISEDLWRFRFSGGYGFSSERMKGSFGGVEIRAHDWVTLLGEYDTRDLNAGIRITTPEIWKTPIHLTTSFKSALNHNPGNIDVAVGITFPLDFRKKSEREALKYIDVTQVVTQDENFMQPTLGKYSPLLPGLAPTPLLLDLPEDLSPATFKSPSESSVPTIVNSEAISANLDTLQKRLIEAGFIHVRVGQRISRELVVEYENTIYNHNELDAMGVVTGIVSEVVTAQFAILHIVVIRNGIRVAVVSAPLTDIREFMKQQPRNSVALRDSVTFSYDTSITEDTNFHPEVVSLPFPKTSLILAPGLQTFVGTEAGVFDYVLSFRPEILSTLWNGGVFQARWDIPLVWSSNFDDGKVFRESRNGPQMDRAMLFQAVSLAPGIMANLGAGLILQNSYGTLNELTWSPAEGTHRLRGVHAWANDPDNRRIIDVYLSSYRYFYAPFDLSLEATGGQFWGQDRGFSLELKRFFTDTAVSTYYKNSTTSEGKHWQAAGIQFAFPLTPRKDLKTGSIQVRGSDEWSYAQETTLAIGSQKTNDVLKQALAINPQPTPALYRSYYNRDRLNADYIKHHLERFKEAWLKYRINSAGEN